MVDKLGNRLKTKYEDVFRVHLPQRSFGILRVDGKAFHTFTRKLPKPYSYRLGNCMDEAARTLCKEMMVARFAYGQSDEYSFRFSGNIQKITSIASSIFTATFNRAWMTSGETMETVPELAHFDSRVFVIPDRNDVIRYFQWRQIDASRNSLNSLARCHFSHKELMGKAAAAKHEMLHSKDVNWAKQSTEFKRGRVIRRITQPRKVSFTHSKTKKLHSQEISESIWTIDKEIPVFTRTLDYLETLISLQKRRIMTIYGHLTYIGYQLTTDTSFC